MNPPSALDPRSEYEVYRNFDKLAQGKTAIYISHRLSSTRFTDRIAVFEDGRIVELGQHDELDSPRRRWLVRRDVRQTSTVLSLISPSRRESKRRLPNKEGVFTF